ncbi:MAG: hypothetical protein JXR42_02130 [Gammaproteobacteria bacterium]|nr:hypothetical protein [Gammaproteobacteria bacterium]
MQFNLLPWREKHAIESTKNTYKISLICFLASMLLCLYLQDTLKKHSLIENNTPNIASTNKQKTDNAIRQLFYNGLRIIINTPNDIHLTSSNIQHDILRIRGTAISNKALRTFFSKIKNIKLLKTSKTTITSNKNPIRFIIKGTLNNQNI